MVGWRWVEDEEVKEEEEEEAMGGMQLISAHCISLQL
jgi:hypothetical protein